MHEAYEVKILADGKDDAAGRARQPFSDFMKDFLVRKYGLKTIAMKHLGEIYASVQKNSDQIPHMKMFGLIAGMVILNTQTQLTIRTRMHRHSHTHERPTCGDAHSHPLNTHARAHDVAHGTEMQPDPSTNGISRGASIYMYIGTDKCRDMGCTNARFRSRRARKGLQFRGQATFEYQRVAQRRQGAERGSLIQIGSFSL